MMENLEEIHKKCQQIFRTGFYEIPEGSETDDVKYFRPSKACKIYDKLTEGVETKQDCIGENFNQLIERIDDNWFGSYKPTGDLDYYFYNYFLLLYMIVERVELIFEVINPEGKSKLFNDFKQNNFKTLLSINKWANFIKHPKEFLFTHWATYYIKGDISVALNVGDVNIDTDFIFRHYSGENKARPVILENNNRVFVEVPELETITKEFCREMNIFFDFICCNQIVADFLKKKSTVENHYTSNESETDNNTNVI